MYILLLGIALFFSVHSVAMVCPGWRERMVSKIGLKPWKATYSVVAFVGFVLLVVGYGHARIDPTLLYSPPHWTRHITFLLMIPVFPLFLASLLPGRIHLAAKHPTLAGTKIWAFAHLISNGTLADVLLFGTFLVWAVADRISMKHRPHKTSPALMHSPWNDAIAVVGGLAIYAFFLFGGHAWLIGMPLISPN